MNDELEVELIDYDNLDENLKEQVRDNYRNDPYFIPDDWYEHIIDDFMNNYPEFEFNENDVSFDIYHNTFNVEGTLDLGNQVIRSCIPEKLQVYLDDEWAYDISDSFNYGSDTGINNEYYIDDDLIRDEIENKIFPNNVEVDSGVITLDISTFKEGLITSIDSLKSYNIDISIIETWISQMEAHELFFQPTIIIQESDYDDLITNACEKIHSEISSLIEQEFYSAINDIIETSFKILWENLKQAHEFHFSDEYADDALQDKSFQVTIDDNGNQVEILDLDGE